MNENRKTRELHVLYAVEDWVRGFLITTELVRSLKNTEARYPMWRD